jgi:serine/threonine-protein kinase
MWLEALRETARVLANRPDRLIRELPEVCRPGGQLDQDVLGWLISRRNEVIHTSGSIALSTEECEQMLREARPIFEEFLAQVRFLLSYPLGFVTAGVSRENPADSRRGYCLHGCMGATIDNTTEAYHLETEAHFEEDIPFVAGPDGKRVLYLWPLLLQRVSPIDSRHTLYLFEDMPDRKLPFLGCVRYSALTLREEWRPVWRDRPASDHQWLQERLRQLQQRSAVPAELRLAQRLLPWRGGTLSGLRLGNLQLLAAIGRGGFGTIYAAVGPEGRKVAVKVLEAVTGSPRHLQRFRAEFNRLQGLWQELERTTNPPGIIRCFESDVALIDGRVFPWYSMEFALGGDLGARIRERQGRLPGRPPWNEPELRAQVVDEFRQVASAVAFLHQRNIVHRDLKPSNVLVMDDGRLRLSDFGLAKNLEPSERSLIQGPMTSTGAVLGTRFYMAPEQEQGKPITQSADVYSLGVLLAEMALGDRPEPAVNVSKGSTLKNWRRLNQLAEPVRRFLLRLTDIDPDKRPADAEVLLQEFAALAI